VAKPFTAEAIQRLQARNWPGNVRELRNAVERLLILATGKTVVALDVDRLLPASSELPFIAGERLNQKLGDIREDAERVLVVKALRDHEWNISEAARALGVPRSNLYMKIKKLGLKRHSG
jgi:DNA-binding NtrC family response regulator